MAMDTSRNRNSFFSLLSLPRFSSFWRRDTWTDDNEIRIYAHSGLLYWWPVWLYAAFCWLATYVHHEQINPGGLKAVNVFPSPWLGFSFLCVFFFVVTFSHLKMRGFYPLLVIMAIALLIIGAHAAVGLDRIFGAFHLLFIYMNEAFYAAIAIYMCGFWCVVVFIIDRMTCCIFTRRQVIQTHAFDQEVALDTHNMIVRKQPPDLIRHKILGLAFLGVGTGDLICRPSAAGAEVLVLENVVGLNRKLPRIQKLLSTNVP